MSVRAVLFVLLALAPASSSLAQSETDLCNAAHDRASTILRGEWVFQQLAGLAYAGPIAQRLPAEPQSLMMIESFGDDGLLVRTLDFAESMVMDPANGTLADIPDGLAGWGPNGEAVDIEANTGCVWSEMPRFVGSTDYELEGAGTMRMTMILHFPNAYWGLGYVQFRGTIQGREFAAERRVMLSRGTP